MKYVVLVSHGEFAEGLANALMMLAGQKEEVNLLFNLKRLFNQLQNVMKSYY